MEEGQIQTTGSATVATPAASVSSKYEFDSIKREFEEEFAGKIDLNKAK